MPTPVLSLLLLLPLLPACWPFEKNKTNSETKHIFRWAIDRAPETLHWTRCAPTPHSSCERFIGLSMEGLTRLEFEQNKITTQPNLASTWDYQRPNELIVHLKRGVKWSNGEELVAADFLRSWKKLLESRSKTSTAPWLHVVQGVTSLDPWTLRIRLSQPCPIFHRALAHYAYWPTKEETSTTDGLPKIVLGRFIPTGTLSKIRWVRNTVYHGPPPSLHEIELQVVPSAQTRVSMLEAGETDLVDPIPNEVFGYYQKSQLVATRPLPLLTVLTIDSSRAPLSRRDARLALTQSLRSDEWSQVLGVPSQPARGIELAGGLNQDPWDNRYAPVKAKKLFSSDAVLVMNYGSAKTEEALANNLSVQWFANLDLRVDLASNTDAVSELRLIEIAVDPFFPAKPLVEMAGKTRPRWLETVEAELAASRTERQTMATITAATENVFFKEVLAYPLAQKTAVALRANRVSGLKVTPLGDWDFSSVALQ